MSWPRTRRCDTCDAYDFHRIEGGSLGQVQISNGTPAIITVANPFNPSLSPYAFHAVVFTLSLPMGGLVPALPSGVSQQVPYYVVPIDPNHFSIADTLPHALAGTLINTTTDQVGVVVCDEIVLGCHLEQPLEAQIGVTPKAAKWRQVDPDYWCKQWTAWNPL